MEKSRQKRWNKNKKFADFTFKANAVMVVNVDIDMMI